MAFMNFADFQLKDDPAILAILDKEFRVEDHILSKGIEGSL